jgi:transcriptional regulator with XRE-family HTH domain
MGRKLSNKRNPYGAWMRRIRMKTGMTQAGFCKKVGIPQSTYANWEIKGALTGRKTIIKLAKAMKVPVAEFLKVDRYK